MTHSILVIEDNPDVTHVVQHELEHAGFTAFTADTGARGLEQARTLSPDLVILDLGLPDFDGAEVARQLRRTTNVPIVILTAIDAIERKVELFGFGANDYITKPFHPNDLINRVNALLHHTKAVDEIVIGALEVHMQTRTVTYQARELQLSPREFEVLAVLARQAGRIFTPEQLLDEIWGEGMQKEAGVLEAIVGALREKLRSAGVPDVVRVVRGMGYALRPSALEQHAVPAHQS